MKGCSKHGLVAALVAAGLLAGCAKQPEEPAAAAAAAGEAPADEFVSVTVATAAESAIDETLAVTGSIFARTDVNVAAKIGGRVTYLGTDEGRRVDRGTVLVRLDAAAARASLKSASGGLTSARAMLAKAQLNQGIVDTQSDTGVRSAEANLAAARARLAQAVEHQKLAHTKSGEEGVDIAQAESRVVQARSQLAQAQDGLRLKRQKSDTDIATSTAALAQSQAALQAAQAAQSQAETALQLAQTATQTAVDNARQASVQAQNRLDILQTGARSQERAQAESQVASAKVAAQTAEVELNRAKYLFDRGAVSKAQLDNASLSYSTRNEQLRQAEQQLSLVKEGARTQELAIAQSQLTQATDALRQAQENRTGELKTRGDSLTQAKQEVARANEGIKQAEAHLRLAMAGKGEVSIAEQDVAVATQALSTAEQAARLAHAGVSTYEVARQEVHAAETQVAAAEQALRMARSQRVSPQINRQDISSLRGSVRQAEAAVASAAVNLSDHTIVAPLSGGVAQKAVEVGEVVSPGQMLFRLVSDRTVHFEALVPEEKVRFVRPNSKVDVRVDAVPGEEYIGHVLEILPAADLRSRTFTVKIGVDNRDGRLRQGMFARGVIVVSHNRQALWVPAESVVRRDEKNWVVKIQNGDTAVPVEVEVGTPREGLVEVLQGNVNPGDQVAVEGAAEITAEQKVKVTSAEAPG